MTIRHDLAQEVSHGAVRRALVDLPGPGRFPGRQWGILLAADGEDSWPSAGNSMAARGAFYWPSMGRS
jgi:hypothetical protein